MKTREDHANEHDLVDPLHANRPIIVIIVALLVGGILMTVLVKTFPPDNALAKPTTAKIMPRR